MKSKSELIGGLLVDLAIAGIIFGCAVILIGIKFFGQAAVVRVLEWL